MILPSAPRGYFHVYQMFTIRIKTGTKIRDNMIKFLSKKGIMSKVYFYPVHLTKFYRKKFRFVGGELPVTENLSKQVLTLPLYPTLTKKEIDYIIEQINIFLGKG